MLHALLYGSLIFIPLFFLIRMLINRAKTYSESRKLADEELKKPATKEDLMIALFLLALLILTK